MKTGTLYLVISKNRPVFGTLPFTIGFMRGPKVGKSFLFSAQVSIRCGLSATKRLTRFKGFTVIQTRNSTYILSDVREIPAEEACK